MSGPQRGFQPFTCSKTPVGDTGRTMTGFNNFIVFGVMSTAFPRVQSRRSSSLLFPRVPDTRPGCLGVKEKAHWARRVSEGRRAPVEKIKFLRY